MGSLRVLNGIGGGEKTWKKSGKKKAEKKKEQKMKNGKKKNGNAPELQFTFYFIFMCFAIPLICGRFCWWNLVVFSKF